MQDKNLFVRIYKDLRRSGNTCSLPNDRRVLKTIKMQTINWAVTPCHFVGNHRFRATFCRQFSETLTIMCKPMLHLARAGNLQDFHDHSSNKPTWSNRLSNLDSAENYVMCEFIICTSPLNINREHIKSGKYPLPLAKSLPATVARTLPRLIQWPTMTKEQTWWLTSIQYQT